MAISNLAPFGRGLLSESRVDAYGQLFNPTDEHRMLRDTVASFKREQVEPQAAEHDEKGTLNLALFKKVGELGLLGITVPEAHGGAGMDAVAAVIAHHELSKSDPGFCLAYLAHAKIGRAHV